LPVAEKAAAALWGPGSAQFVSALLCLAIAGGVSAMVWAGPRIYYAMACDGVFLRAATRVHPRHRTPVFAILAQAVWSSVLVLSGTLSQLVEYTGFAVVLFSAVAVMSVFVLRFREPNAARPFRAWGYPLAPGFFILASLIMVVYQIVNSPETSLRGIGVILAGFPIYWLFARKGKRPIGFTA
jgi:APA family basic amino acid/polyamine antiporter